MAVLKGRWNRYQRCAEPTGLGWSRLMVVTSIMVQSGSRSVRVSEMLQLNVSFPSGRSEKLSLLQSSKVGDLKVLAQKLFQCGFLKLVTANNDMMDPAKSLQAAGLQEEDHLTAIAIPVKVAATDQSYRIVVLWREPACDLGRLNLVMTALESKINSRMSNRFREGVTHSKSQPIHLQGSH